MRLRHGMTKMHRPVLVGGRDFEVQELQRTGTTVDIQERVILVVGIRQV